MKTTVEVRGPWSLETSLQFWYGFGPNPLPRAEPGVLTTTFLADGDWMPVTARVEQRNSTVSIDVAGDGDLDVAASQVARFLAIDVDGTAWPEVGRRDAQIGELQREFPGLRPCGFYSPYEAAVWAVLSQRIRMTHAVRLKAELAETFGTDGAFPSPQVLRDAPLELPGRKAEFLRAVADAALEGVLDGAGLRALDPADALLRVQQIDGIGPFGAELIVLRGANAPDAVPRNEARFEAEFTRRYGPDADAASVIAGWQPFRTWAAFQLRVGAP